MDRNHHFLLLAAYNNAIWCDTICRSQNVRGEFHDSIWICRYQTPMYYPNLVTLLPTANLITHDKALAELLTVKRDYTISVKDSFADLDLTPFGFTELFQARWIIRQVPAEVSYQETADLEWKLVISEIELLRWEEAWSQGALPIKRIFLPTLLHDADVCIIAAYKDNQIIAGGIANRSGEVVGLSNVFAPKYEVVWYWEGLIRQVAIRYPRLPIVGYEHDESLTIALRVGFTTLGPLRVWIKEG